MSSSLENEDQAIILLPRLSLGGKSVTRFSFFRRPSKAGASGSLIIQEEEGTETLAFLSTSSSLTHHDFFHFDFPRKIG